MKKFKKLKMMMIQLIIKNFNFLENKKPKLLKINIELYEKSKLIFKKFQKNKKPKF